MRKLFDDYVVIRPLHDPFRLSISIRNLLAAQESGEASAELRQLMASIRSSASAMDGLVRESLREGATIRARLVESGETLKARMRENLQALAGQMAAPEFAGVVSVNDQAALGERLSRFAEEKLAGEVASQLQPAEAALTDLLKRSAADYTATAEANAGVSAWLDAVKPQVLVVDDDAFYLTVLTRMLAGEGFEIVTATDPLEGLNLAVRLRPAAIMVDFEMPGMTGLDFIARVRSAPRLAGTPVLMLTGHAERELVQKAIAAGVSGYLIKPGNKETLLKKLRQHIAQSVPAKHAPAMGQRA
jgi:CheY-like chemotaxis protein